MSRFYFFKELIGQIREDLSEKKMPDIAPFMNRVADVLLQPYTQILRNPSGAIGPPNPYSLLPSSLFWKNSVISSSNRQQKKPIIRKLPNALEPTLTPPGIKFNNNIRALPLPNPGDKIIRVELIFNFKRKQYEYARSNQAN